jgi:hypothetical protein
MSWSHSLAFAASVADLEVGDAGPADPTGVNQRVDDGPHRFNAGERTMAGGDPRARQLTICT